MDLGIRGRRALVCAASRGLGKACALALAREGAHVTITARREIELAEAAIDIERETGQPVAIVCGDISDAMGRRAALDVCAEPDILVTNVGGPPLAPFAELDEVAWSAAVAALMLAPIALVREVHPGMMARGFGRIVNITSAYVKAPTEMLALSSGPRAGLTAALAWLARHGTARNVTINNLLPEMIMTERAREGVTRLAERAGESETATAAKLLAATPAGRFGEPEEFGAACAFLCGAQAGFITNQNIVIDGGHYAGLI